MEDKVKIFKALGNERRLQILKTLLKNKELPVSEIAQNIGLSLKSTSKHLQKLEAVDFIKRKQRSFWGYYQINEPNDKLSRALFELLRKGIR